MELYDSNSPNWNDNIVNCIAPCTHFHFGMVHQISGRQRIGLHTQVPIFVPYRSRTVATSTHKPMTSLYLYISTQIYIVSRSVYHMWSILSVTTITNSICLSPVNSQHCAYIVNANKCQMNHQLKSNHLHDEICLLKWICLCKRDRLVKHCHQ